MLLDAVVLFLLFVIETLGINSVKASAVISFMGALSFIRKTGNSMCLEKFQREALWISPFI